MNCILLNKNRPCEPDTSQQQERMRALKIHALNKHIVSFGAAKCKRNTRSPLAVIFILFFTYIFTKE